MAAIVIGKAPIPPTIEIQKPRWSPEEEDDGVIDHFYKGLMGGFLSLAKGVTGTVESGVELIAGENEFLSKVTQNIRNSKQQYDTTPENAIEFVANVVGQALPYMGAAMAGGAGGGAIAGRLGQYIGGAAIGFSVEGQNAYDAAKARGASETVAESERLLVGSINAFIEASQVTKLLKLKNVGKQSLKSFVNNAKNRAYQKMGGDIAQFSAQALRTSVNEAFEEFLQEGVSLVSPALFEGKKALPLDAEGNLDWSSIGIQLGTAALAGGLASPVLGAAGVVLPGKGYDGLQTPKVGLPSVQELDLEIQKVTKSKLPYGQKKSELAELNGIRELVTGEVTKIKGEIPRTSLHDRLAEKTKELDENIRPVQKKEIAKERGIRSAAYMELVNEYKKAGSSETLAHIRAMGALKGELVSRFPSLLQEGFTEQDMDFLRGEARISGLYKPFQLARVNEALSDLFIGETNKKSPAFGKAKLPGEAELKLLEPLLGTKATNSLRNAKKKSQSLGQKIVAEAIDAANLPRALLASWDFSAPGRQGILILFTDPKAFGKGVWAGYRAFVNKEYANFKEIQVKTHDMYNLAKKSGLEETEIGGGIKSEEPFTSTLAEEVPMVLRSERAYVVALNTMRFEAFYSIAEDWAGTNKRTKDYEQLAQVLNHLTGRGDLKALEKLTPILNMFFFSPKLQMARIQTFTDLTKVDSPARKVLAGTLLRAFSTGSLLLMLIKLLSMRNKKVSVELNPLSSDFAKIKIGNTRIDYWGGYSQIMRAVVQTASGYIKSTQTGEFFSDERLDIFSRFLQTKLSPAAGLALDVYRGEDFKGDIVSRENMGEQFYSRFTPLFIQDVIDAARYQGMDGLVSTSLLALHGVGAMTYPQSESAKAVNMKNHYALQYAGVKWNELGPDFQNAIREQEPLIGYQENKARTSKLGKRADAKFINEARKSERTLRRGLGKEIVNQLDRLFINLGGISRKIGTNWYLTDKRYSQYRLMVLLNLKKLLPSILDSSAPNPIKRLMAEDIIDKIKKQTRLQLMREATIADIKRAKGIQ